jgi:ribosomal protein S18 acetylase RimI-like enzyme
MEKNIKDLTFKITEKKEGSYIVECNDGEENIGYVKFDVFVGRNSKKRGVFMGSYVSGNYRSMGIFNRMFEIVLKYFKPKDTLYAAVANRQIVNMFIRYGFKETKESLPHWGRCSNTKNMKLKF